MRTERQLERIRALLDLSRLGRDLSYLPFVALIGTGIANGFLRNWWGQGWLWTALDIFVAINLFMTPFARFYLKRVRAAVGLPDPEFYQRNVPPPGPPASPEDLVRALASGSPTLVTLVSVVGVGIIIRLMLAKPF
ncbi:MAG: hypothetical protein FJ029_02255 [Actinobacteria bacterium]|nr:hypothetical protein [Actinomycetota bacterium]